MEFMTGNKTDLRWIVGHFLLEGRQIANILVVQPFHFEVQIHIVCTFTQSVLLMVCWEENKQSGMLN